MSSYSCRVYDHFHIKRCNKCQQFGHYEAKCNNTGICGICAGNHETKNCEHRTNQSFKDVICINCKKSPKVKDANMHSHTAFSPGCPCYLEEQDKLKRSIAFYEKQKNLQ